MKRFSFCFPLAIFTVAYVLMSVSIHNNASASSLHSDSQEKVFATANVLLNPETGIMNLYCSEKLQSPVNVKIVDNKGNIVSVQSNLKIEGIAKHKYIQLSANAFNIGTYRLFIEGANGAVFQRVVNIQK